MAEFLSDVTGPLAVTPHLLRQTIEAFPEDWLERKHADDVVSPRAAVAHLTLCECYESWIDRLTRVIFPDTVIAESEIRQRDLLEKYSTSELLVQFETGRNASLEALPQLVTSQEMLSINQTYEDNWTESVENLLNTWVAHDLYHIGQIYKSYASVYRDKIGPYQYYLNLPHFN